MAKRDNQLAKFRRSPKNVSPKELDTLLVGFGFRMRGQKGSHRTYTHAGYGVRLVISQHRPLDVGAVKEAINAIDRILEEEL